jgi:ABC-type phosphate/phosphonate transport system substrate-binding protein
LLLVGCAAHEVNRAAGGRPATQPVYDTTAARPIQPRDALERMALRRGVDFAMVDKLMDKKTDPPAYDRQAAGSQPARAPISDNLTILDDRNPFAPAEQLAPKEPSIFIALARSTYRTHDRQEVLAAVQPFLDIEQRRVNVRPDVALFEKPDAIFFAMADGQRQLAIAHVFDYLLIRSWFSQKQGNGTVLLGVARPGWPTPLDATRDLPGIPSTSVVLLVRSDSKYQSTGDLTGARLAVAANDTRGAGTFLTQILKAAKHNLSSSFFSSVALRRYEKDAALDLINGRADVACVSEGTAVALQRMYGLEKRLRVLAASPRYDLDVLFTSMNNVQTHRTEIELTQRQLNTLGKDPEGQEVLYFFDQDGWQTAQDADIAAAEAAFDDFLTFAQDTPADLKILLDPEAPIDRQTYDRFGND